MWDVKCRMQNAECGMRKQKTSLTQQCEERRVGREYRASFLWLLVFLLLPAVVCAEQKPDAGQMEYFLKLAANARTLGMGASGVACKDAGIFHNPAGIAWTQGKHLQLMFAVLPFPDTSYTLLSYTQPVGKNWGIGIGVPVLKVTGAEKRTGMYESSGTFDDQQMALGLGLARSFSPRLSAGLTLKAIQQRFDKETTSSGDIDLGMLYQHPLRRGRGGLGISLQNILGSTVKHVAGEDKMPQIIMVGIACHPIDRMLLAVDIKKSDKQAIRLHLGGEYSPFDILSLRIGYDDQGYLTAGVGIRTQNTTIDYGLQNHDYKLSHRVSVGVMF
ncbi:MAG: PorV/PorQ family protein [bacterium]|nr:PorV/PorQ family protein [bacterium]